MQKSASAIFCKEITIFYICIKKELTTCIEKYIIGQSKDHVYSRKRDFIIILLSD